MTPLAPRMPYSDRSAGSFSALMDSISSGLMPMSRPPGPGVYGTSFSRNNGAVLPSATFTGGGGLRPSAAPGGVNVAALNEPGPPARVTPIAPPANVWMTTPDDLAWRSRIPGEELAVLLLALGGCDGAEAQPAAI